MTHVSFKEGPYRNKTYRITNPEFEAQIEDEQEIYFQITDGGNTLETRDGIIVGHYVPALRTH